MIDGMMLTIDELATLLNALRYYREHNRPHEQESELIGKLEGFIEFDRKMKFETVSFIEDVRKQIERDKW